MKITITVSSPDIRVAEAARFEYEAAHLTRGALISFASASVASVIHDDVREGLDKADREQPLFEVTLLAHGDRKIHVIKAIREVFGWGLKEAKDASESPNKALGVFREMSRALNAAEALTRAGARVIVCLKSGAGETPQRLNHLFDAGSFA